MSMDARSTGDLNVNKTDQQLRIIEASDADRPLKVVAYAGTGKTKTIEFVGQRQSHKTALYVAFNASAAADAKRRMPANVEARTFHSLGWQAMDVSRVFGFENVGNAIKLRPDQLRRELRLDDLTGITAVKLTLRRFLNSTDEAVTDHHVPRDVLVRYPEHERKDRANDIARATRTLWVRMADPKARDYQLPHDGYLKLWWQAGGTLPVDYDLVFLDEGQDMNPLNWALSRGWKGQTVVVGDPYQQLYAFRGAIDALSQVDFPTYYLSQSFRFGDAIAEVANWILLLDGQDKEPLKGNPAIQSEVTFAEPTDRHTILCRTNAGLLEEALMTVETGHRFCVVGDIEDALKLLESAWALYRSQPRKVRHPSIKLFDEWDHLLEAAEENVELKMAVKRVKDYGGRIPEMVETLRDAAEVRPDDADVILSTVHKAKGMEWPTVKLADDFKYPYSFNKKTRKWTLDKDERNVLYVAATRAVKKLHGNTTLREIQADAKLSGLAA